MAWYRRYLIMGIGAGAIKTKVSPLVTEQYTGKHRKVFNTEKLTS